jgi:amino acid transporter
VDTVTGPVSPERRAASAGLAREAIGLREVLFQSITHMAPAAAVAFSIIAGAGFAAGALPLSVLLALVGCLLVAISIGQLAKHLPSAGSFYTYTSRGIHPAVGFLVAWGYSFVEALVAPILFLIFGHLVATVLHQEFGWRYSQWWWVAGLFSAVVVFLLGYFGIRISARTGTVLGVFEIGVFTALAIWLIAKADHNTLSVFGTSFATSQGFKGFSGVVAGSIYTILAFIGFEAAAPLAEETLDPRRNIRLAVIYSAIGIGIFYVLTTYAAVVFFGPSRFGGFAAFGGGNPWDGLAREVWGAGWFVVFLAIANSALANSNAASNATTRTWYAMGRIRLFPSIFAHTHPRWKSPDVAVFVQFAVGVFLTLFLGAKYGPFPVAFVLVATINVAIIIAVYMLVNLSCLLYYLRERRQEFNLVLHGVIPLAGIAVFVPAFFTAVGIGKSVFSFVTKLPPPFTLVGPIDGIGMGVGVLYLIYLYVRHPERVRATGRVFIEETGEPAVNVPTMAT